MLPTIKAVISDADCSLWIIWEDLADYVDIKPFFTQSDKHGELQRNGLLEAVTLTDQGDLGWPNGVVLRCEDLLTVRETDRPGLPRLMNTVPTRWAFRPLRLLLDGMMPGPDHVVYGSEQALRGGYGVAEDEWRLLVSTVARSASPSRAPRPLAVNRLRDFLGVLQAVGTNTLTELRAPRVDLMDASPPSSLLDEITAGGIEKAEGWVSIAVKREQQRRTKHGEAPCFIPGRVW